VDWATFTYTKSISQATPNTFGEILSQNHPKSKRIYFWGGADSADNRAEKRELWHFQADNFEASWELETPVMPTNISVVGIADPNIYPPNTNFILGTLVAHRNRLFLFYTMGGVMSLLTYGFTCPAVLALDKYGDCTPCPSGSVLRNSTCFPCDLGETSLGGTTSCTPCPSGTFGVYADDLSRTVCQPCAAGTFANQTGQTSCLPCPDQTASIVGSSNCSRCPPGQYASGGRCASCPLGQTTNVGQDGCELCPPGFSTTITSPVTCVACNDTNMYSNATTGGICISCPAGHVASLARSSCVPCPSGQYHPGLNSPVCVFCFDGYSSAAASTSCVRCPSSTYSSAETSRLCTNCPDGLVSSSNRAFCLEAFSFMSSPVASASPTPRGSSSLSSSPSQSNYSAVIAAIVLACILGIALIALVVLFVFYRKARQAETSAAAAAAGSFGLTPSSKKSASPTESPKGKPSAQEPERTESSSGESSSDKESSSDESS
jgi:hypothetical protein